MKRLFFLCFLIPAVAFAQNATNSINSYYKGLLPGEFSVSPTQKVSFSKGNLQFKSSTKTWQFAEHQYDLIGEDPDKWGGQPLQNIDGWIDLILWGQNGCSEVYPGDDGVPTIPVEGPSPVDWGYEPVSNGGIFNNMWRSLSMPEWRYLLINRKNAKEKFSTATVCGVKGIILLPDNWTLPTGCTFNKEDAELVYEEYGGDWRIESSNYSKNIYNQYQWTKMENNGAVFLPAAADLDGFSLGWYWTSSATEQCAQEIVFDSGNLYTTYEPKFKSNGMSVRLVKNNTGVLYKAPTLFLTKLISVEEVGNRIKATFDYFVVSEWITIDPNAYLETNTGVRAKLVSTEGIKISPEKTVFEDDSMAFKSYRFSLFFDTLPKSLSSYESFSIVEGGDSEWTWTNIHINR